LFLAACIIAAGALAACGAATTTGTSGNPPPATATTAPTATARAKPTSVPPLTQAFCQGILSVAQVNQIVDPSDPAVTLAVTSPPDIVTCEYQNAQGLNDFIIAFQAYTGPYPVSASQFSAYAAQIVNGFTQGGGTVTTNTLVNGVGDHAAFLAESITAQGATIKVDSLIALDGKVVIACANYSVGSSPDATQLSDLTRCGQRTVSQL
jgi:hypothetical protein